MVNEKLVYVGSSWSEIFEQLNKFILGEQYNSIPIYLNEHPISRVVKESQVFLSLRTGKKPISKMYYDGIPVYGYRYKKLQAKTDFELWDVLDTSKMRKDELFDFQHKFLDDLIKITAFSKQHKLEVNEQRLLEITEKLGIPKIKAERDIAEGSISVMTADFMLAKDYPEEYVKLLYKAVPTEAFKVIMEDYLMTGLLIRTEYYTRHIEKSDYKHAESTAIYSSLKDLVPVAVKFGDRDNAYFSKFLGGTKILDNRVVSQEAFDEFCKKLLVIDAPSPQRGRVITTSNTILYTSKADLLRLSGIRFNSYSILLSSLIFKSIFNEAFASQYPFMSNSWAALFADECRRAQNAGMILSYTI